MTVATREGAEGCRGCGTAALASGRRFCVPCARERYRATQKRGRDRRYLDVRLADPRGAWAKGAVNSAAFRCRANGREFSITRAYVLSICADACPCCGVALKYGRVTGKRGVGGDDSPTLDRIDNSKGYVPANVAVLCWGCNRLKRDATAAQLRGLLAYVDRFDVAVTP